jgi:hypothetical protein
MKNIILSCAIAVMAISNSFKKEDKQPPPFVIDECTYIQPILENEGMEEKYQYTRTIKFYYKDPMPKPIELRNGTFVSGYCSDQTEVTFVTMLNDTVKAVSVKDLNCVIRATVNFEQIDIVKLRKAKLKILKIKNLVSDNEYVYYIHTDYFQKYLKP